MARETATGGGAAPSNYTGNDPQVAAGQMQSDACIREICRLKIEGKSTLSAQDRLDLQELVVLWDNAYDGLDRDALLALMTEDVEFISPAFGTETTGKEQMGAWFDAFTRTFTGKRHLLTNFIAVGDGRTAKMLSYLTVFERIVNTDMVGSAVYYDDFVKQDGRWLMRKRLQFLDPGMTATTYGQSLISAYRESIRE